MNTLACYIVGWIARQYKVIILIGDARVRDGGGGNLIKIASDWKLSNQLTTLAQIGLSIRSREFAHGMITKLHLLGGISFEPVHGGVTGTISLAKILKHLLACF